MWLWERAANNFKFTACSNNLSFQSVSKGSKTRNLAFKVHVGNTWDDLESCGFNRKIFNVKKEALSHFQFGWFSALSCVAFLARLSGFNSKKVMKRKMQNTSFTLLNNHSNMFRKCIELPNPKLTETECRLIAVGCN